MDFNTPESFKLKTFFENNRDNFETALLEEAVNVKDKINQILMIGNIDLVNNAHTLVMYIIEGKDEELQLFAEQEGIAWANHSIALSFKLEWVQAIRRTLWIFIEQYNELSLEKKPALHFFSIEQEINNRVDQFLNGFFISYSAFKDKLITEQKELVENLSVPIIPLNPSVFILPFIGSIDAARLEIMEKKVLQEVGKERIEILIMDLSGIANMEGEQICEIKKMIDGIAMMGCETVITGLRKEIARKVTDLNISFNGNTKTIGTLQQALHTHLVI